MDRDGKPGLHLALGKIAAFQNYELKVSNEKAVSLLENW